MLDVAVVGATGAVGETIVRVLEERGAAVATLAPFASRDYSGAVRFRGRGSRRARDVAGMHCGVSKSCFLPAAKMQRRRYAPALIEDGAVVIDNSATFRMRDGVPLIVPGVNPKALRPEHRLLPVANCTAIVLCTALAPVRDVAGLRAVRVATYQAASGAGRAGLDEFSSGERALALGERSTARPHFQRTWRITSCRRSAHSTRRAPAAKRRKVRRGDAQDLRACPNSSSA